MAGFFIVFLFYSFSDFILVKSYDLLSFLTLPVFRAGNFVTDNAVRLTTLFQTKYALTVENEKLRSDLDLMELDLVFLDYLRDENEDLLFELGRDIPSGHHAVVASVLSGPNLPPYENLIIDVGRDQGLSMGDLVIFAPNVVLGEIEQVYGRSSKVRLYSSSGVQTNVLVPLSEPIHAIVSGYGGGTFILELPSNFKIPLGTRILIPGREMYVLGIVSYLRIDPTTTSEKVFIKYPVNTKNIKFVHVIKIPKDENIQ